MPPQWLFRTDRLAIFNHCGSARHAEADLPEDNEAGRRRRYRGRLVRPHVLTPKEVAVYEGGHGFFRRLAVLRGAQARYTALISLLCRNHGIDMSVPDWRDQLLDALLIAHVPGFRELYPRGAGGPRSRFSQPDQQKIDELIDGRSPRVSRWKAVLSFAQEKLRSGASEDAVRKLAKQMEQNYKYRQRRLRSRSR